MTRDLVNKSAKIFGGSAIASLGFSFGRDIYAKGKKNDTMYLIILIVLIGAVAVGNYSGGLWLTRNYRSIWKSIFVRVGAVLVIIPCFLIIYGIQYSMFKEMDMKAAALILPSIVLLCGLIAGWRQRSRRTQVWDSEIANRQFMLDQRLVQTDQNQIEDQNTGQLYRIESVGSQFITLFPLGRRGKRAYIKIGEFGRYREFTGMVAV